MAVPLQGLTPRGEEELGLILIVVTTRYLSQNWSASLRRELMIRKSPPPPVGYKGEWKPPPPPWVKRSFTRLLSQYCLGRCPRFLRSCLVWL